MPCLGVQTPRGLAPIPHTSHWAMHTAPGAVLGRLPGLPAVVWWRGGGSGQGWAASPPSPLQALLLAGIAQHYWAAVLQARRGRSTLTVSFPLHAP